MPTPDPSERSGDRYAGALLVLLAASIFGAMAAWQAGRQLGNAALIYSSATLLIAAGVLAGVALAERARSRPAPPDDDATAAQPVSDAPAEESSELPVADGTAPAGGQPSMVPSFARFTRTSAAQLAEVRDRFDRWIDGPRALGDVKRATAIAGLAAVVYGEFIELYAMTLLPRIAALAIGMCVIGVGLAATAARYLGNLDRTALPESRGLTRGARVVGWVGVLAAAAVALQWYGQPRVAGVVAWVIALIDLALCYDLFTSAQRETATRLDLDVATLSVLGSRLNVAGSILDSAQRQLGIDLRSTWALTVVRRSVEPLVIALCFVGWLSTMLTVVGVQEQGLVERLGVPVGGSPLEPGLHVHWPWPIDKVYRLPVKRVQRISVGHEGEEEGGPEDVIWAREHAANEYTLLLGNGRDLITIDAAVQYRIADPRAWRYHSQNPVDALRAISYRAVMRNTVNRTLAEALSENVVETTARMRAMVQEDADALGLGVTVLGFTVGGMHPPVAVAPDYQSVVSAELGKVTAVVNAEAYRNRTVPAAESVRLGATNAATADAAQAAARATGEASSFVILQSQYGVSPGEFFFRRRLEKMEQVLASRPYTIIDARIQRDGGELWLTQ